MRLAAELRQTGHTYEDIGERLSRPRAAVKSFLLRNKILSPKAARHATMLKAAIKREAAKKLVTVQSVVGPVTTVKIPPELIAERDNRLNEYRTPAQIMMGDPPFSQSALAVSLKVGERP